MSEAEVTLDQIQALADELKERVVLDLPPEAVARLAPLAAASVSGIVGALIGRSVARRAQQRPVLGSLLGGLGGAALGLVSGGQLARVVVSRLALPPPEPPLGEPETETPEALAPEPEDSQAEVES